jgi:histidinol-phosphatase (PHP family)
MYDVHIHTAYSIDSSMPVDAACGKAIKAGFKGITVTDHLDIDYPGYEDEPDIDFYEYMKDLAAVQERYHNRLTVFRGIEIGYQPHVLTRNIEIAAAHDFDFIISSVHVIGRKDPYNGNFYESMTQKEAYSTALQETITCINDFTNFDIIGHYDYIARYGPYENNTMYYKDYSDYLDIIFKMLISSGKGLEINTSTYKPKIASATPLFDIEVIKAYRRAGGEIITLGSDAHDPEHIGYRFEHYRQILLECGFKYTAHFENRKPVFDKIL